MILDDVGPNGGDSEDEIAEQTSAALAGLQTLDTLDTLEIWKAALAPQPSAAKAVDENPRGERVDPLLEDQIQPSSESRERFGAPALSCRTSGVDSEGESVEPSTAAGSYRPTSNP